MAEQEHVELKTGKAKDGRYRQWSFVIPEAEHAKCSAYLRENGLKGFVSPAHDQDKNEDGTDKFAHRHVMLKFEGKKSMSQLRDIAHACGAVNDYVKPVDSWVGYARYLKHLDNPEKAQYSGDVECFGGLSWIDEVSTAADDDRTLKEIMQFVVEQGVTSFFSLSCYAAEHNDTWFRLITSKRTLFLSTFLKSAEWTFSQARQAERLQREMEQEQQG